jgi:hypothetical protein
MVRLQESLVVLAGSGAAELAESAVRMAGIVAHLADDGLVLDADRQRIRALRDRVRERAQGPAG